LAVPGNTTRRFYKDLQKAGIPRFKPSEGVTTFHSLRVSFATFLLEEGADIKTAMTLMRHATPDLTVNRYAKARRERLVEFAEAVGEIAHDGVEDDPECVTSVLPKVAVMGTSGKKKNFLEQETGVEPAAITLATWRSTN